MLAKFAYEKEFYFFDKFTIPAGSCGQTLTYSLIDNSNSIVDPTIAVLDEIALVPGKKRIYLKSAAFVGSNNFKVRATNEFGSTVTSSVVTITVSELTDAIKIDYYQDWVDLWKAEIVSA